MLSFWLRGLLVPLLAALAACASLEPVGVQQAADLELKGRVAYRHGDQGGSAAVHWRHAASFDDLLITGPLGQGIARITRTGQPFRLTTADGKEFQAADVESLTEAVLGWRLPLAGLPDWVRGRPVAQRPARMERDDQGQLRALEQDEWRIEYQAWKDGSPSRMSLRRAAAPDRNGLDLRLVLVIDELSALK